MLVLCREGSLGLSGELTWLLCIVSAVPQMRIRTVEATSFHTYESKSVLLTKRFIMSGQTVT